MIAKVKRGQRFHLSAPISLTDTIDCTGVYDQANPPINCWIFPGRHGTEDIIAGIQNSCNVVFAELGHRLSMTADGTYSPEKGLSTIRKYASMFGLDHTSGVELPETEPHLTTEDPERSAMGQGTNSYNNVQLSRYISAVANRGTVFELSLLDKLTDSDGNLITDYTPAVSSHVDAADSTWNAVQAGIRRVVTDGSAKSVFAGSPVEVAGKTGTAQEDRSRANHAFFVSFAPYSNPEVCSDSKYPLWICWNQCSYTWQKSLSSITMDIPTLEQILGSGAFERIQCDCWRLMFHVKRGGSSMQDGIVIKSSKAGMTVILNPDMPFAELLASVAKKFGDSARFWGSAQMTLTLEGRSLTPEEEFQIVNTITENSQLRDPLSVRYRRGTK